MIMKKGWLVNSQINQLWFLFIQYEEMGKEIARNVNMVNFLPFRDFLRSNLYIWYLSMKINMKLWKRMQKHTVDLLSFFHSSLQKAALCPSLFRVSTLNDTLSAGREIFRGADIFLINKTLLLQKHERYSDEKFNSLLSNLTLL